MKIVMTIFVFSLLLGCGGSASHGVAIQNLPQNATFIVYIGDSIFLCYTAPDPARCPVSPGFPFAGINASINSDTLTQITLPLGIETRLFTDVVMPCKLQSASCLVVVEGGHNDIGYVTTGETTLIQVEAAAQSILDQANFYEIPAVMLTIPPVNKGELPSTWKQDAMAYNSWLTQTAIPAAIAKGYRVAVADVWPAMADSNGDAVPGMLFDGVHPTQQGMATMNQVMSNPMKTFLH